MDDSSRLGCRCPDLDLPGAHFLYPGGEVSLQTEQLVAGTNHAIQTRLVEPHVGQERIAILVLKVGQLLLDGCTDRHDLCAFDRGALADLLEQRVFLETILLVVGLGRALDLVQRLLDGLKISQGQLGIDRIDIGDRIDLVGDMDNVGMLEAAHDMRNRVDLTDMREEFVAKALALGSAGNQTGDIDELHRGRDGLLRLDDFRQCAEARIRHRHNADVRINRAERKVRRSNTRLGQRIE